MRLAHIITNLGTGGAEMMLLKLVQARSAGLEHVVLSLRGQGTIGPQLEESGAKVLALQLPGGRLPGPSSLRLVTLLQRLKPHAIQGWMYHGNLAAAIVQPFISPKASLLWSIRCSFDSSAHEKLLTRSVIGLGRLFSSRPRQIIYNAKEAMNQHIAAGFSTANAMVIPNGFDLARFRPRPDQRMVVRKRLSIEGDAFVVGHLARVHPMKSQETLVQACASLLGKLPNLHLVAAGHDMEQLAQRLPRARSHIEQLGSRLHLLPEVGDVSQLLPAFDVFALSSAWGEGFPNVLGEAMASGVPCVATDVGDSRHVIGDTGVVVPPSSTSALESALLKFAVQNEGARLDLGLRARRRVQDNFAIESVVRRYESVWTNMIAESESRHAA